MATTFYVHRPLGETVQAIGGSYRLVREARLRLDGAVEVLYLVGHALFDTTCCGVGGCAYVLVQGVIRRWQAVTSADGLPMTEIEPIADEAQRERVRRALAVRERVNVVQVSFR
jgi:hypothetical protein